MEAMSTTIQDLDLKWYGRLLARAVPKVIKTEQENERAFAIVESPMKKGKQSPPRSSFTPKAISLIPSAQIFGGAYSHSSSGESPRGLW